MADNASLASNMQSQFAGVQDPFGAARIQQSAISPDNQFQGLSQFDFASSPGDQPVQQQDPSMGQLAPQANIPFQKLAKDMGIDVAGLHSNPDLAKLQLAQRMQEKHGPTYMQTPDAAKMFQAFDAYSKTKVAGDTRGDYTKKQENTQEAVTARTLAALMGGAPSEG